MYLITRPKPKLESTKAAFHAAGLNATVVATSDIAMEQAAIRALTDHLQQGHKADRYIVTSPFAVDALTHVPANLTSQLPFIAVGSSTCAALAQFSHNVVVPDTFTSEGILRLDELSRENCSQVIMIKGEGGRTAIADELSRRGIAVTAYCVYRRVPLTVPAQTNHWEWQHVKGIIATSETMARQLWELAPQSQVSGLPWLTVSDRVAASITRWGATTVSVCTGASDSALIQWVKDFWE
ncbi:uroporphyrinogen-III synthase [Alteromonas sp. H39]|uniref:uroporphyrinogen-III synthase n=1 Tax=Alteromonas sp. H39 TaxID=3389876 RepID=UPI0039E04765